LGFYERLLKEREEEERRRGRPLGHFLGSGSPVLDGLLADVPKDRPKRYGADLRKLHRYIHKGVRSPGAGTQYMSLKKKHPQAYRELKAEAQGQGGPGAGRAIVGGVSTQEILIAVNRRYLYASKKAHFLTSFLLLPRKTSYHPDHNLTGSAF
jgi:hypothetical protein